MSDRLVRVVLRVVTMAWVSGQRPGAAVVDESEPDEPAQVECGGAVVQPVVVFGHAAIANLAVATGQPGDGAFDHRPMSPIFVAPLWVSCLTAGFPLQRMVWADPDDSSGDAGGAAPTQRAAAARRSERRPALAADAAGDAGGAGDGAVDIIDSEIVDARLEPTRDRRSDARDRRVGDHAIQVEDERLVSPRTGVQVSLSHARLFDSCLRGARCVRCGWATQRQHRAWWRIRPRSSVAPCEFCLV